MNIQYLTDEQGKKTAVVIPLEGNEGVLEQLLEDLEDFQLMESRKDEECISEDELLNRLKADGLL